jgi:hypothetical protein
MALRTPLIPHHALLVHSLWLVFDSNSQVIISISLKEIPFNGVELIFFEADKV